MSATYADAWRAWVDACEAARVALATGQDAYAAAGARIAAARALEAVQR